MRKTLILFASIVLVACAPKALITGAKPPEINDIQRFETFSYITLIDKGNRGAYNDTISLKAKEMFGNVLKSFKHKVPVTDELSFTDPYTRGRIARETEYICVTADRNRNLNALKITPTLDSLLETNNKRFGLLTITTGFTRRKGNFGGQVAKGIGIGILTLGMAVPTPIKANSTIYVAIVNAQENKVVFFHKIAAQEEPLNSVIMSDQIEKIFKGYFWK